MAGFWRDLVWTAVRDTVGTLRVVMPSVLAMLTLVALGAALGWVGGALVGRLARAVDLDRRSRTWGLTGALARAGVSKPPSLLLRLSVFWSVFLVFAAMRIDALPVPVAPSASRKRMHLLRRGQPALLIL